MKQPVDAGKHVFMLYKFSAVCLFDALLNASDEASLIVQHPSNGVFHQLLGVLAAGRGHLLEPCFDVGGKCTSMPFQGTRKPATRQTRAPEVAQKTLPPVAI